MLFHPQHREKSPLTQLIRACAVVNNEEQLYTNQRLALATEYQNRLSKSGFIIYKSIQQIPNPNRAIVIGIDIVVFQFFASVDEGVGEIPMVSSELETRLCIETDGSQRKFDGTVFIKPTALYGGMVGLVI